MTGLIVKWAFIALTAVGAVMTVANVGKPRKPITGGTAAGVVVLNALIIVAVIAYWGTS
jgi:hypothetical protein